MKPILNEAVAPKRAVIAKCIAYWVLFIFLLFLLSSLFSPLFPPQWNRFLYGLFGTSSAFFTTWIFLRSEHKSFANYGLVWRRDTLLKFLKGLFIGTLIFSVIILMLILFSELQLERNTLAWEPSSALWYGALIPLAFMEELAFRSYTFLKLNRVFGLRITQIIIAIAFAFYHIVQGWGIPMAFLGPGIWALVFGLAAIWSNGIALPTGIHVALNLIQELIGLKGGTYASPWVLQPKENASTAIAPSDVVGLLTQVLVLLSAILLTEYLIRKKQR